MLRGSAPCALVDYRLPGPTRPRAPHPRVPALSPCYEVPLIARRPTGAPIGFSATHVRRVVTTVGPCPTSVASTQIGSATSRVTNPPSRVRRTPMGYTLWYCPLSPRDAVALAIRAFGSPASRVRPWSLMVTSGRSSWQSRSRLWKDPSTPLRARLRGVASLSTWAKIPLQSGILAPL